MIDVTAIGELLIDFASLSVDEDGYPTMAANPGGAPPNFLAALSRYGMKTAMLGKVGTDAFGKMLIGTMKKAGIETMGIVEDDSVFTTLAFVTFSGGDRSFSFARKPGADTCLRFEELDLSIIDESRAFHFGTLSLTDEPSREATQKAVAYAKEKGKLITLDPNLRLSLWTGPEAAREQMLWAIAQADIVKISDDEVKFLFDCDEHRGADILLNEYGVSLAMVTLGPRGCYLKNKSAEAFVPCLDIVVKDTTGAGDIFGGSALSRVLREDTPPGDLSGEQLLEIARFASAAANLSTLKSGGIPSIPSLDEVENVLDNIM